MSYNVEEVSLGLYGMKVVMVDPENYGLGNEIYRTLPIARPAAKKDLGGVTLFAAEIEVPVVSDDV